MNIENILQEAVEKIMLDEDLGNLTVLPSQAQTAVKRALQDNAAGKSMLTPNSKVSKIEYNDANDLIYKIRNRVSSVGYQGYHAAVVVAKSKTGIEGYVIFAFQKPLDYENASRFSSKADGLIYATTYTAAKRTFKEWQAKIVDSGEAWLIAIDEKVRAKQAERAANKPYLNEGMLAEGIEAGKDYLVKQGKISKTDCFKLINDLYAIVAYNKPFINKFSPIALFSGLDLDKVIWIADEKGNRSGFYGYDIDSIVRFDGKLTIAALNKLQDGKQTMAIDEYLLMYDIFSQAITIEKH